jgi:hypothetical protein
VARPPLARCSAIIRASFSACVSIVSLMEEDGALLDIGVLDRNHRRR